MAIPFEIKANIDMCMQYVSLYDLFQDDGFGDCLNTNFLCAREVIESAILFIEEGVEDPFLKRVDSIKL